MVGNINELGIFDDNIKNSYKLIIPLQFWFCRHVGLSLPTIALRYSDIILGVKFKDLSKLCYVEDDPNLMDIANIQTQYHINITNANLYVDYIFLDTDERKRFAQTSHEYLIETVQYNEFEDVMGKQFNAHLNFAHPTKFIIWFAQPKYYRENTTGRNKCQWNNWSTGIDKNGYSIDSSTIKLNLYNRTDPNLDIKYFNFLQPHLYFSNSPTDGYNLYSFAIKPKEHQPSGTINLSRIDDFSIVMNFTDKLQELCSIESGIYVGVYVMSYNILRIIGGMAGLAFTNTK